MTTTGLFVWIVRTISNFIMDGVLWRHPARRCQGQVCGAHLPTYLPTYNRFTKLGQVRLSVTSTATSCLATESSSRMFSPAPGIVMHTAPYADLRDDIAL